MLNLMAFTIVSFLGVISPGPAFFIVLKNSLLHSRKIGLLTALGVSCALIIHLTYTLLGIGLLLSHNEEYFYIVKTAGSFYLFILGLKTIIYSFKKTSLELTPVTMPTLTTKNAFYNGFFVNLLNPWDTLFFLALFAQFIAFKTPTIVKVCYACINWTLAIAWYAFLTYLVTVRIFIQKINRFKAFTERVMGLAFILFSLKLLWS